MTGALVYKEFRETLGIATLGLIALLAVTAAQVGLNPVPGMFGLGSRTGSIPFVSSSFGTWFWLAAAGLAIALGFRQSIGDFWNDAQLFLLHRPVSRARIYATKLAVGLAVYLACALVALLGYALWAATPGTHASPFEWSMTAPSWATLLTMTTVYLGAFLAGIRPAAWFGTRLSPLVAALVLAWLISFCWLAVAVVLVLAVNVWLMGAILTVVESRNFS
jgi:hypothetical protein